MITASPATALNNWAKKPNKLEPIRNYTKLLLATKKDAETNSDRKLVGP